MVFKKGVHLAAGEKWPYDGKKIETVNSYNYLGFRLTTKLFRDSACLEWAVDRCFASVPGVGRSRPPRVSCCLAGWLGKVKG